MNAKQIKETYSISDLLRRLGYEPQTVKGRNHWYLSMIREAEQTPSFKVDVVEDIWYDHGLGFGGNIIDLGIYLFKTRNISIVLTKISDVFSSFPQQTKASKSVKRKETIPKIKVIEKRNLENNKLINYLQSRGINSKVASKYCKEYNYTNSGNEFISIAFPNVSGGAELRGLGFKSCIAPKDVSLLKTGGSNLLIFEGFIDFLSYQMIFEIQILSSDFLVLNSLALQQKAYSILEKYERIYLFLDNDEAGRNATKWFKLNHSKVLDMSLLYKENKDLNEYLMQNR